MEAEVVTLEEHCTELSTVTNTDLHKAWHLLGLLLTIGRPVRIIELASRCTLFRVAPEFVEFLCSLPYSPLKMTGDLFVTLSSVAILAFGQFVVNSNTVTPFVLGFGGFRHKRVWEDVERTYYRKRRKVRSEFDDFPVVKKNVFSQNVNGKES